jgi:hypothetical protein
VRDFEQSSYIEVEGYKWSKALWQSSLETNLPAPLMDEVSAASTYGRPVRIVKLDRQAAPLIKGGFVGYDEAKDFDWLFAPNCDWLVACVHQTQGIAV